MEKCKLCNHLLSKYNKSGYCTNCYTKSPYSLEYQRNFQKRWYSKKINKDKKREYHNKPDVKRKTIKYQKKYQKDNIERIRELKRNWERKNRRRRRNENRI